MGIYAGSKSSYIEFSPLFKPIVEQFHERDPRQRQQKLKGIFDKKSIKPFTKKAKALILTSSMRMSRNLDGFPFSPALD